MIVTPTTLDLPLYTDTDGVIRVAKSRVTLHTIISWYWIGETPETIHEGFETVPLADIYVIIAYYLSNRDIVDAYMQQIDDKAEAMRKEWQAQHPQIAKAELQARLRNEDK